METDLPAPTRPMLVKDRKAEPDRVSVSPVKLATPFVAIAVRVPPRVPPKVLTVTGPLNELSTDEEPFSAEMVTLKGTPAVTEPGNDVATNWSVKTANVVD